MLSDNVQASLWESDWKETIPIFNVEKLEDVANAINRKFQQPLTASVPFSIYLYRPLKL